MDSELETETELESEPECKVYFTRSSVHGERSQPPSPKRRKKSRPKGPIWSYKEKKALYNALQKHGFNDTSILAEEVKTRTQNEVELFIDRWTYKLCSRQKFPELNVSRLFARKIEYESSSLFPPIALWKKAAQLAINYKFRSTDHTRVFEELFQKFKEDEPECDRPHMPNFKTMYKFLYDIVCGANPPTLAPLESFTALLLIQDTLKFIENNNFEEEKKFAREYLGPIKFAPCVKKESKSATPCKPGGSTSAYTLMENAVITCSSKGDGVAPCSSKGDEVVPCSSKENGYTAGNYMERETAYDSLESCNEDYDDDGTIHLPLPAYLDYVRHVKIKQNLNPLLTHVYMLHEEQNLIKKYIQSLEM